MIAARIMPKREIAPDQIPPFTESVAGLLRKRIGIGFEVEVLAEDSLERAEYKARRWIDKRARNA